MRVLHVYNMANDAYNIALGQRKLGIDAHLVIDETHSVFALPHWEEVTYDTEDIYCEKVLEKWEPPSWIHVVKSKASFVDRTIHLFNFMKGYDILQGYPPAAIYLQYQRIPYIVYECGWMRIFPYLNNNQSKLARLGYKKANHIIMTNPDMYYVVSELSYLPDITFIPFAIPMNKCKYVPATRDNENIIYFNPARQSYNVKGSDKLIEAFVKYLSCTDKNAVMYLTGWGTDLDKTKLKIASYPKTIRDKIVILPVLSKPQLMNAYQTADVVCDQFLLGSYGTSAPEAMACGSPVLMFLDEYYNKACYGAMPPVANAYTVDEIVKEMFKLEEYRYRNELSERGRKWVEEYHDPIKVARKHMTLYEKIL